MDTNKFAANLANVLREEGRDNFKTIFGNAWHWSAEIASAFPNAESYGGYLLGIAEGRVKLTASAVAALPLPDAETMQAARKGRPPNPLSLAEGEARKAFQSSPALRSMFASEAHYLAFARHEAQQALGLRARFR